MNDTLAVRSIERGGDFGREADGIAGASWALEWLAFDVFEN